MNGPRIVTFGAVALLSLGAQSSNKVVSVEIIVDTLEGHVKRCTPAAKIDPTTVLAVQPLMPKDPGENVRHCVNGALVDHDQAHEKFPQTIVHVSAGQSIRWFSKSTSFRVSLRPHNANNPLEKGAPAYPFEELLPNTFLTEVTSPVVIDVVGNVQRRYKVSFELSKPGNAVDPDVVCSM